MAEYRLPEQKYAEADLFQTIEKMAKSDEEYDVELCSSPPPSLDQQPPSSRWKEVPARRTRWQRRCISRAPPAPPSTPTSLTANSTPTPSPTAVAAASATVSSGSGGGADDERLSSLLYILDYAPKYKKKLREQQRTDAELAELFDLFTITGGGSSSSGGGSGTSNNNNSSGSGEAAKLLPERGISAASRAIRRSDATTKIFKIHRNPKEFFREGVLDEEDSVSAPEYDNEEESRVVRLRYRRFARRPLLIKKRSFARFEQQERMDAMLDTFDAAMSFNGA